VTDLELTTLIFALRLAKEKFRLALNQGLILTPRLEDTLSCTLNMLDKLENERHARITHQTSIHGPPQNPEI
jgi:hypothetical protein